MMRVRNATWLAAVALSAFLTPFGAQAWFEASTSGTRALGLADAFVSVADDASALYWNPAGLVQLRRHELLVAFDHRSALSEVRNGFAALAVHRAPLVFGASWQHTGIEGAAREDLWTLGVAGAPIRRSLGAFVSLGAALEIARVGIDLDTAPVLPGLVPSETKVAGSVGILLAPIPNVVVGATFRHLGDPRFDLVAGGDATVLEREFEWGASLRFRRDAWIHLGRVERPGPGSVTRVGVELRLGSALGVRAGVGDDVVSGGVDLRTGRYTFEAATRAHEALGLTYRAGLRIGFGSENQGVGGSYDEF